MIRRCTIEFSKSKWRELLGNQIRITNRLIKLKNLLVGGDFSVKAEIFELKSALGTLFRREQEGGKLRSRAKWIEEGEKLSRFFFKLARERFDKSHVYSIYEFLINRP